MKIHFIYVEMVNSLLEFASPQSYYKIFVGSHRNTNYTYWSSKCEGKLFLFHFPLDGIISMLDIHKHMLHFRPW